MRKFIPRNAKLIPKQAECKFHGQIFDVYQWPQQLFDGSIATFEMLRRADTTKIIAIKDNKIIITKQKQPRKDWFYTYPGGRVENDDPDELAGAKRELLEETGLKFKNWKLIDATQPFAKIDWLIYTFVATDLIEQTPQQLDGGELIEVLELNFAEFMEYVNSPDADYLRFDFREFNQIKNLDDLISLPAIYNYTN